MWASEMAHWVKVLVSEPENLNLIHRGKELTPTRCPLTFTGVGLYL